MGKFFDRNWYLIGTYYVVSLTLFLVIPYSWSHDAIKEAYNYLIQFSGIFSAIVITVIISKVFSLRQENFKRKEEIIYLSNKVSDLRRIAKVLVNNESVWPANLKRKLNSTYSALTYEIFIDQTHEADSAEDKLISKFIKDTTINKTIGQFFLALKSIQGKVTDKGLFLYTEYDYNYIYNIKIINLWLNYNTANSLWNTLEHEYSTINTKLVLSNLNNDEISNLRLFAKKIDPNKYSNNAIPINKLLADIGTHFDSLFLPRLGFLLYENRPILPGTLSYLLNSMIAVMFLGVIVPIFFQSINVFNELIIHIVIASLLSCFIILLYQFRSIITKELDV